VVDHQEFATRAAFDARLAEHLREHGAEWVVLAGFMRVLTPDFLASYRDRVVNIHPSLLPAFPGKDAQAQAFAHGVKVAGCTVHFVDSGVDTGPIIAQAPVPVVGTDTEETLRERILKEEHRLLPAVLGWIAEGRVTIERVPGQRARVVIREARPSA
jgi:phosphoribosylglycinamide formyltransferase-1